MKSLILYTITPLIFALIVFFNLKSLVNFCWFHNLTFVGKLLTIKNKLF